LDGWTDGLVVGVLIGIAVGIPVGWLIAYYLPMAAPKPVAYTNEEVWQWVDYKGRDREIRVHRDVRPNA